MRGRNFYMTIGGYVALALINLPEAGAEEIEEVVVTAQRREANLQSTPIAISAVTADSLKMMQIKGTEDLAIVSPGLNMPRLQGTVLPFIRGVGVSGSVPGTESGVAIYVDDVYMMETPDLAFSFNNIERVEVLRGPQGTLFGRNALGGVVRVITKDPSFDPILDGTLSYGNYDTFKGSLYASIGLGEKLAVDVALAYANQSDGYGKNIVTGNDANKSEEFAIRSKWLYRPNDWAEATLAVDYMENEQSFGVSRAIFPGAIGFGGTTFKGDFQDVQFDRDSWTRVDSAGAALSIKLDFSFAELVSVTSYRDLTYRQYYDLDNTPFLVANIDLKHFNDYVTQELRLDSPNDGPFIWTAGVYYLKGQASYDPAIFEGLAFTAFGGRRELRNDEQGTESISAYGQVTVPFLERNRLTLGARYTDEERSFQIVEWAANAGVITYRPEETTSFSEPTWTVVLDREFTPNAFGYASYSRGFKSGLYDTLNSKSKAIDPEILDSYEVGLKLELLKRTVRLNLSAFYYDYNDVQLTRVIPTGTQIVNGAQSKIYGGEAELLANPIDNLTIRMNGSYTHARYEEFPDAPITTPNMSPPAFGNLVTPGDASDHYMMKTPTYTFSVGVDYFWSTPFGAVEPSLTYYYNGGFYWDVDNRIKEPSYHLLNAQVAWSLPGSSFRLRLFGSNLLDEEYHSFLIEQQLGDQAAAAPPRTYGVAIDYSM